MSTWDAARLASRRPLPKPRKMMGPVGPEALKRPADGDNWCDAVRELGIDANALSIEHTHSCCGHCGHHVCSCEPVDPYAGYAKAADATLAPEIQAYLKYARFCAEKQRGVIPMVTVYGSDGVERHITVDELNRKLAHPWWNNE